MTEKICRLCFGKYFRPFSIFGLKGMRLNVAKLIRMHFPDEVSADDNLPKSICNDCWPKLEKFHEFYNAVEEAKNIFLKNTGVKEEVPDFIEINCDAIDFEEAIPSVKVEQVDDNEDVKLEAVPNEESKREIRVANASHDNDVFDADDFSNSRVESDSDEVYGKGPLFEDKTGISTRFKPKIEEELPAPSQKESIDAREERKRKRDRSKAKSETKKERKIGPKSVILESDFQNALKYMRVHCELCDYPFETLALARIHCRNAHNSTAKFVCCNRRIQIFNFNDHLQYHLNPDVYKCNICDKRSVLSVESKAHKQSHLPKEFECDICKKRYVNLSQLRTHIQNCHACEKQRYECHVCKKRFDLKNRLDIHVRVVHERQEQQVCHICAKVYMSAVGMKRHLEEHSGIDPPTVNCEKCGDSFKHLRNLKRHMKKHNEAGKIFQCPHCAKISPSRAALSVHIASVHSKPMLECHLCDKKFKRTLALNEHVATHTGEDLYDCNYCPQKFKYHSSLYLHYRGVHPIEWNADRKTKPKRQMKTHVKTSVQLQPVWNPQYFA